MQSSSLSLSIGFRLLERPSKLARGFRVAENQRLGDLPMAYGFSQLERVVDQSMLCRLGAHRVGGAGIAGQHEGLAAAAAVVLFLVFAGAAGFRQPGGAAKAVEQVGLVPDGGQILLADIGEFEAGQHARRVAGQGEAVGRHREKDFAPAVHAFLRAAFLVIRGNEENLHFFAQARPPLLGDGFGVAQLFGRGHQRVAIQEAPAVVLGIGQFQVFGAEFDGHLDDAVDVVDIGGVQHAIDHRRVVVGLGQAGDLLLEFEGAGVGDQVVGFARRVLEGKLDVVEAGGLEGGQARLGEADAGGDEVGVEAEAAGFADQDLDIVAEHRLAAGNAELRGAHGAGLADDAEPFVGRQFRPGLGEIDRVVAEGAVQRAAVGDFGEQP